MEWTTYYLLGYESSLHLSIGDISNDDHEEDWLVEMKLKIDRAQQA